MTVVILALLALVDVALIALGGAAVVAAASGRAGAATGPIYAATAAACGVNVALALAGLGAAGAGEPPSLIVPVGLPWLSAHLRLDGLSAFFLVLVNGVGAL